MTTGRILHMKALREQGMTYQAIADEMGCTRQYVCNLIGKSNPLRFQYISESGCIYPGLRKWMNDNMVSRSELLRRMGRETWPSTVQRLSGYMRGTCEPSKSFIDEILRATGLTYEQCFGGEI